jgi:catechol 2,3-dioxygenase-like lactoylglutathione lyase family enzyme
VSFVVGGIDHVVLVVADVERTVAFYRDVLGCTPVTFSDGRHALALGDQKINLHAAGHAIEPRPARQEPGSGNLCFVTPSPLAEVVAALQAQGVAIALGPVPRAGAQGPMTSVYLHDPDGNLLEVASYADPPGGAGGG